jgi:hypothetical protein
LQAFCTDVRRLFGRDRGAGVEGLTLMTQAEGRIIPGKDHYSSLTDVISEGVRAVWSDKADPRLRSFA